MHHSWKQFKQIVKKHFPTLGKLYTILLNLPSYITTPIYQAKIRRKLSRIYQQNTRKIRVGFLVSENEKWASQTLFDKLKQNPHFEPVLLLSSIAEYKGPIVLEKFEKNRQFFKKACGEIIEVFNPQTNTYLPLEPYKLDIIFYQQPWGIPAEQAPRITFHFALLCYIPYSFEDDVNMLKHNLRCFHNFLFREYISHDLIQQKYTQENFSKTSMKVVGYPKLEKYLDKNNSEKKYVIYAPHHAIEPHSLRLGTFAWNGHFMLEYAKKHPEFNWIFKPHPRCKISFLAEGLFKNRADLDAYYRQWATIGQVYESGDYIDLFQQAKCLITDCGSFLVEFFPTQQPVIHLKRADSNIITAINQLVASTYYSVFDLPTLKKTLHMVLEEGKDPMLQKRIDKLSDLSLVQPASDHIIRDLEETFLKG